MALPVDRWGNKPGEEPESPTLQHAKKQEMDEGTWVWYHPVRRFPVNPLVSFATFFRLIVFVSNIHALCTNEVHYDEAKSKWVG